MQRSPLSIGHIRIAALTGQCAAQRGFTLIELIVVLLVISVMAVVAIPRFSSMMGFADVGYRDQVVAAIDYARKIAVAQRRHTCVVIGASSVTVKIDRGLPQSHATNNCLDDLILPSGSNVINAPSGMTQTTKNIDFNAQGQPVSGAPATITFTSAGGETSTITMEADSGYVH
jgi:MSHA pilin protein MshC